MCGIFGVIGRHNSEDIKAANRTISHRGPDAEGYWHSEPHNLTLCHRRLSILDLSEAGAQPMRSDSGRFTITYNGEIYNFADLKKRLRKSEWRGHSDTEILLACFEEWGIEKTLTEIEGMYGMAVWDASDNSVTLVRDRLGEKPLYYGEIGSSFLFASELKPFIHLFKNQLSLDSEAVTDYFRRGCVSGSLSIFKGIKKLPAGTFLRVPIKDGAIAESDMSPQKYWSLQDLALGENDLDPAQAISLIETKLKSSIDQQMVADVPLGAFLSGGIDSSLIVALMQSMSPRKVKTFSIGFASEGYNEAPHAKAVAAHLGTEHEELYVTEKELLEQVPQLARVYDEPFADSSQIPTILVSKMARRHVTVALSGDGGDELFAGYNRHVFAQKSWPRVSRIPPGLRRWAGQSLKSLSPKAWSQVFKIIQSGAAQPHEKIYKLAQVLGSATVGDLYQAVSTHWQEGVPLIHPSSSANSKDWQIANALEMTLADASWYMPDDVLVKVDRAAMSQSLETRAPFLAKEVVEAAYSLPMNLKIREGQSKWVLRQILYKYVPKDLIERPKMGFGVPLDAWLRKELKDWAWDLLSPETLKHQDVLDPQKVLHKWDEHQKGGRNWQSELWDVLIFLSWRKQYNF